jgi:PAS domain S-box-containing protein
MKLQIQQKIQVGFAVALAFLLLTGVTAWWSEQRNAETFRSVEHTYQVLDQFETTLVEMLNTETEGRGFVLSGDETFLQPQQAGIAAVQESLAAAKRLTQDNPDQQRRLAILEPLIQKKTSIANEVIKLRRSGDTAGVLHLIATGQGQQTMDEIRKLIGEMENAEEQALQQRTARAQVLSHMTIAIVAFGGLLALGLVGLASVIVRRDFEKRQRAEAAQRLSNARYTMLFDSIDEGYCIIEMIFDEQEKPVDYRFLETNPSFEKLTGLREAQGRRMRELAPQHEAHWFETYGRVALTGEAVRFQHRAEQLHRWFDVYAFRFGEPANRQVAILFNDITERKQMDEALRRSEESLAVTLRSIGDAVLATDTQGRVTRMNTVTEKLTGWTQAEALGRPIAEVFHIINEETRQPAVIPVDKVLATGEIHGLTNHTIIIARDGTERLIADSAAPIRGKDGKVFGVVLIFRDVTDEKRAEKMTRESERTQEEENLRRFATVLRDSNDAITIQDFEGRITAWNRGAELMYGYGEAEALLMNIERLTTPGKVAEQREFIRRLIAGEAITSFETQRLTKDGRVLDVWMTVTKLMDDAGKPVGLASTERDITERLKNERLAHRSQRLESIGTLAGGISHDLNNALAPILLGVEILKTQYPQESQIVDMFEASARRGADMVRQLLTFAKGAEGERVALQPGHLVKELVKLMEGSFPKNIELVVKCDPKLPLVLGDATQLHQVLLNLCVNARDAMPHGGTLTLEAQQKEVDAIYASSIHEAKPGKYVVLRVRDTGTGIPPEIIDRIFDPFFTTKSPDKGTGLGLSTVMGIVKGHGGFLEVHSQPGQGSTFAVYLPAVAAGGDTQHITKAAVEFRGQEETILFVDDERALREAASMVLRRLNFKPLTAIDGADGLIQAAQHRTELRAIITDLSMPHMDGLEFVRAVRRLLPDIPIMVASGRMEDAVATEFKTLGVTNLLDKPFTEAQLAEALKTVFKK